MSLSLIEMMIDMSCVRGALCEIGADDVGSADAAIAWIVEGYTIDEVTEGLLSAAQIEVAP